MVSMSKGELRLSFITVVGDQLELRLKGGCGSPVYLQCKRPKQVNY